MKHDQFPVRRAIVAAGTALATTTSLAACSLYPTKSGETPLTQNQRANLDVAGKAAMLAAIDKYDAEPTDSSCVPFAKGGLCSFESDVTSMAFKNPVLSPDTTGGEWVYETDLKLEEKLSANGLTVNLAFTDSSGHIKDIKKSDSTIIGEGHYKQNALTLTNSKRSIVPSITSAVIREFINDPDTHFTSVTTNDAGNATGMVTPDNTMLERYDSDYFGDYPSATEVPKFVAAQIAVVTTNLG